MPHDIFFIGTNYYSSSIETKKNTSIREVFARFFKTFCKYFSYISSIDNIPFNYFSRHVSQIGCIFGMILKNRVYHFLEVWLVFEE